MTKILAPISGKVIALEQVDDPVFSEKMMGDGVAIEPSSDTVNILAPASGQLATIFHTNHAFVITTTEGIEILVHIGLETVSLNGEGFECLIEEGQEVKAGDPIIKINYNHLKENAKSVVTPIVIANSGEFQSVELKLDQEVKAGETAIIEIKA